MFHGKIVDIIRNKKLPQTVTKLFIEKLNISLKFILQSYTTIPKDVRHNTTYFFIMKLVNRQQLQQITINHSSDIDFKDFIRLFKNSSAKACSFLVIEVIFP